MTVDELIRNSKKDLEYGEKPNLVLVNLYSELFGFRKDIYGIIGKLIKEHNHKTVFDAIVDLYDCGRNPERGLYSQLKGVCRRIDNENFMAEHELVTPLDLHKYIKGIGV